MPLKFGKGAESVLKTDTKPEAPEAIPETKKPAPTGGTPLSTILKAIQKEKGEGSVLKGNQVPKVERIPTGVFEFDFATGGGFPQGRMSIVFGVESSGKTNLCLKAIAHIQKAFPEHCNKCAFVDLEGTFDPFWAAQMGVDTEALILLKPLNGEEAVDMVDAVMRASDLALCVVDSIAVMVSTREVEASADKADVGTSPILVKRMCNKAAIALGEESRKGHYPALILINQRRFKIGVMFGDPETMPGGETMKFLSSLTVRMTGKNVADKTVHPDKPVYKNTSVTVKKSKVPINSASFEYDMAMVPVGDLDVGDTDSWTTVSNHLKTMGTLVNTGAGWTLFGETYKTLVPIKEQYFCDPLFRVKCQQLVVQSVAGSTLMVADKT